MFGLKQLLKELILPPLPWMLMLLAVLIFWHRRWARKLLFLTFCLILALHSGFFGYLLRYPLEARHRPLFDPTQAEPYDAIVVLAGGMTSANGLVPFPTIDESMFRRLDEAWRLYRLRPKPILISGGHVNAFGLYENQVAREYLVRWGVPKTDVLGEGNSRDTFESAVEVGKILRQKRWTRYLLVTSAVHMPRSMLVFKFKAPEPIPAPGDYSLGKFKPSPWDLPPSTDGSQRIAASLYEYIGLVNYYWRLYYLKE